MRNLVFAVIYNLFATNAILFVLMTLTFIRTTLKRPGDGGNEMCAAVAIIIASIGTWPKVSKYFRTSDMTPLPLDDKFLLFWHHVKLVYLGPGKVGLTFPRVYDVVDNNSSEEPLDISSDRLPEEPPFKRHWSPSPILSLSGSDEVNVANDSDLFQDTKDFCRSAIMDSSNFSCPRLTKEIFISNELTIALMLTELRSAIPQTCDESTMRLDKSLLHHIHPAFRQVFACIKTPANGDCFYEAVSLALFADVNYMELIRLCTAFSFHAHSVPQCASSSTAVYGITK